MLKPLLWLFSLMILTGVIVFGADRAFPGFKIFLDSLNIIEFYALGVLGAGTVAIVWMKLYDKFVE